ncbi:MAG: acyl carrier protein [Wenzhouxiangella sp.]|nr:acyl carrier protein [Wenzhouxiangella sp.]
MTDFRKQAEQAITAALEEVLPEQQDIDWQSALTSDIGLDSVQIMNLVMEIEDELDLSVPVELLAEVQTLDDLADRLVHLQENPS